VNKNLECTTETALAFAALGQDESESLALGPARPSRGSVPGLGVDGPHIGVTLPDEIAPAPSERQAETGRQRRFDGVVRAIQRARRNGPWPSGRDLLTESR